MPRWAAAVIELALILVVALVLAEGVQAEAVKPFRIPSGSMEPTLTIGQRVLVDRISYRFSSPQRGDIIVLHPPTSLVCAVAQAPGQPCPQGNGREASVYFIKRIVGLPGERLSVRDGHPVINGRELSNEPYTAPCPSNVPACNLPDPITIPKGYYFVMGDNRGNSDDSRYWGPVPRSWIVGRAFFTYWPLNRIGSP